MVYKRVRGTLDLARGMQQASPYETLLNRPQTRPREKRPGDEAGVGPWAQLFQSRLALPRVGPGLNLNPGFFFFC